MASFYKDSDDILKISEMTFTCGDETITVPASQPPKRHEYKFVLAGGVVYEITDDGLKPAKPLED